VLGTGARRPPLPPRGSSRGAPAELGLREFLEAVQYVNRTEIPWRDLPAYFVAWSAVYMRFKRRGERGVWEALWRAVVRRTGRQPPRVRNVDRLRPRHLLIVPVGFADRRAGYRRERSFRRN
jgi:transposase